MQEWAKTWKKPQSIEVGLGQQGYSFGGHQMANSGAEHLESPEKGALGLLGEGFRKTWGWRGWIWRGYYKHRLRVVTEPGIWGRGSKLPTCWDRRVCMEGVGGEVKLWWVLFL